MKPIAKDERRLLRKGRTLLNEGLEMRMLLYAIAAGATLAASPGSHAQVVFTPNSTVLRGNGTLQIDMNNDGTVDFSIRSYVGSRNNTLLADAYAPNGIVQFESLFVAALAPHTKISSENRFTNTGIMAFRSSTYTPRRGLFSFGPFYNVQLRFLGVHFSLKGEKSVHFAWIGFQSVQHFQARLLGWAYEKRANVPIYAGQIDAGGFDEASGADQNSMHVPTSLGLLAFGHEAIMDWRRRKVG